MKGNESGNVERRSVEGGKAIAGAPAIDRRAFVAAAAAAGAALLLGGCSAGGKEQPQQKDAGAQDSAAGQGSGQPSEQQPQAQTQAGTKSLVAVFSWSGHTLQVAERINSLVESDFFRIEPADPYTQDYNELLDIAQSEQNSDARPALASGVDNWDEYGTVYLGYPVWWSKEPQIIKTFLESYDFAGKTVVPFSTSGGSGISGTLADVRDLAEGASFKEALSLSGDQVSSQLDQVDEWLGKLGLR